MGETMALGILGSVVGIGLAWGLLRIFVSLAPANFPRLAAISLDSSVLGFSLFIAVVRGTDCGTPAGDSPAALGSQRVIRSAAAAA